MAKTIVAPEIEFAQMEIDARSHAQKFVAREIMVSALEQASAF